MRNMLRMLLVAGALIAMSTVTANLATAQPTVPGEFGHHVSTCAQTMGFDGTHNPGMHRGAAGWEPHHAC
jgi:hypothetical protein